jgi:hypothetical protein
MEEEKERTQPERGADKQTRRNTGDDLPKRDPELVRQSGQPPKRCDADRDKK